MKLWDLKDGMVVELATGRKLIVRGGATLINEEDAEYTGDLDFVDLDFTNGQPKEVKVLTDMDFLSYLHGINRRLDIVKVWNTIHAFYVNDIDPIWYVGQYEPKEGDLVWIKPDIEEELRFIGVVTQIDEAEDEYKYFVSYKKNDLFGMGVWVKSVEEFKKEDVYNG